MEIIIERPLEAFQNIDHLAEAGCLKGLARVNRTSAAAADEQYRTRPVALQLTGYLAGKFRIDFPVRPFLPGHMLSAYRVTDIHEFGLRAAIDEDSLRVVAQQRVRGQRVKVLHWNIAMFNYSTIIDIAANGVN